MNRKLTSYKTTETLPQEFHRPQRKKRVRIYTKTTKHRTQRDRGFTSSRGFSFHLTGLTGSTEHQTLANNTSTSRRAKKKKKDSEKKQQKETGKVGILTSASERAREQARAIVSRNLWITRTKATARGLQEAEGVQQADREPAKASSSQSSSLVWAMLKDEGRRVFRGGFRADVRGSNVDFSTWTLISHFLCADYI